MNITMKELGKLVGVSEAAISHYETGRREPDQETIRRIAGVLRVTTDYLLGVEKTATTQAPIHAPDHKTDRIEEAARILRSMTDDEYQMALNVLKAMKK